MKFKKIYIEITNLCNMSCSFCPKLTRKPEFMNLETFESIIQKIKNYTDYIYLHVKGEPFLHPNLVEFINLAEKYNLKVNLTSNGTILLKEVLNTGALRQINFSLHSFEGEDESQKEEYIKNILNFSKLAQNKNKIISLRLWNIHNNELDNKNSSTLKILSEFYQIPLISDTFERGKGIKLSDKIYLNFEEIFQWPNLNNDYTSDVGFCHGLNTHLAILVDGTVVPCCLDDNGVINLGNINEVENLVEILNKEKTQNIIEGFKKRVCIEELCKHCQFKSRF